MQIGFFQILAFRTFSKPKTWTEVTASLGRSPTLVQLGAGVFENALTSITKRGEGLYTAAFILWCKQGLWF